MTINLKEIAMRRIIRSGYPYDEISVGVRPEPW